MSYEFYLDQMENLHDSPIFAHSNNQRDTIRWLKYKIDNRYDRIAIKGMDIGELKHYNYSYLKECGLSNHNIIQETAFGRLFRATLDSRQVTIKKWDFLYPIRNIYLLFPAIFQNELVVFMNQEYRTHRNLPDLIGFSCEEVLAAVYDCQPMISVHNEITSDALVWDDRMKVAIEIGDLMHFVHSKGRTVGTINAKNVVIDKDGIVKLMEIGMDVGENNPTIAQLMYGNTRRYFLFRSYGDLAPGAIDTPLQSMKADIYAYGILLVELMSKEKFSDGSYYDEKARNVVSDGGSLVDESFKVPKEVASTLSKMAINCLHIDPLERPEISDCLHLLKNS